MSNKLGKCYKRDWILMDKSYAMKLLEYPVHEFQRPINIPNMIRIRREMIVGQYRGNELCIARLKKIKFIMNARHSIGALTHEDVPDSYKVWMPRSMWSCDTLQQLKDLYGTFDPRSFARGRRAHVRTLRETIKEAAQFQERCVGRIFGAFKWDVTQKKLMHGGVGPTDNEVRRLLECQNGLIEDMGTLMGHSTNPITYHTGCVRAMLHMYQAHGHESMDVLQRFWHKVGTGEELKKGDPALQLRRYFSKMTNRKSGIKTNELYARCISAFKAELEGKKVSRLTGIHRGKMPTL